MKQIAKRVVGKKQVKQAESAKDKSFDPDSETLVNVPAHSAVTPRPTNKWFGGLRFLPEGAMEAPPRDEETTVGILC
ncbi:hypothetical protein NP233_g3265 [Leucocoprinus birnbaumii]|uniref:Uncharacterized protein n=1 Tax=Leucocoprinus birnbaumii TaxID=56174 RepID=A0AAD5VZF9_9AGAR|nr:hypothetical protein NP233_g3265 [Leucocoprinus birnbaumii]